MFGYNVEVVKRNELHKFQILPKRWIVERTFALANWSRRLSKDYELRHTSAETMIHIAFAHPAAKDSLVFRQVLRKDPARPCRKTRAKGTNPWRARQISNQTCCS
jgi:hypothetical protein